VERIRIEEIPELVAIAVVAVGALFTLINLAAWAGCMLVGWMA
jgi:hypothetical protein